jgi:hypothetical protein
MKAIVPNYGILRELVLKLTIMVPYSPKRYLYSSIKWSIKQA